MENHRKLSCFFVLTLWLLFEACNAASYCQKSKESEDDALKWSQEMGNMKLSCSGMSMVFSCCAYAANSISWWVKKTSNTYYEEIDMKSDNIRVHDDGFSIKMIRADATLNGALVKCIVKKDDKKINWKWTLNIQNCAVCDGVNSSSHVSFKPKFIPSTIPKKTTFQRQVGGSISIKCISSVCKSSSNRLKIYWMRQSLASGAPAEVLFGGISEELSTNNKSQVLTSTISIKEITADDFGSYQCIAFMHGLQDSQKFTLRESNKGLKKRLRRKSTLGLKKIIS